MSGMRAGSRGALDDVQRKLFMTREYDAIRGRRWFVLWLLYAILLVALAAVAIGRTGLDQLSVRMDDPFTSWLEIPASNTKVYKIYGDLKTYLEDSCAANGRFQARQASGSYISGLECWSKEHRAYRYVRAKSFGFWQDADLREKVLALGNLVEDLSGGRLRDADAYRNGVVMSKAVLQELGYTTEDLRGRPLLFFYNPQSHPLVVLAVVHTLPSKSGLFMEHALLAGIRQPDRYGTLSPDSYGTLKVWLDLEEGDQPGAQRVLDALARYSAADRPTLEQDSTHATHDHVAVLKVNSYLSSSALGSFQEGLNRNDTLRPFAAQVGFGVNYRSPDPAERYGDPSDDETSLFDNLSITFSELDSIRAFQRELQARFKVELDMDRVDSRENFGMISRLSEFLISALVLFAAMSILVFLYNLLKGHLERIKMNLGTFMAFGLSESFLQKGYMRIILKLLLQAMGLAVATLLALQGSAWLLGRFIPVNELFSDLRVIDNPWLYGSLAFLLGAGFVIFRWQLRRFLSNTPGDLIYART